MARLARSLFALALFALGAAARASSAAPTPEPAPVVNGREIELRGEVVELDCYVREGRRGESQRACALPSLAHGGSLAVVADDSGLLYPLAGDTPASDPNAAVRDLLAQHVAITGRLYERAHGRVLVIDEVHRLGD